MKKILLALLLATVVASKAGAGVIAVKGPWLAITAASNAQPIVVTTATHGLSVNDWVEITGALGNTNANGVWRCNAVATTTCTLSGAVGNGTYTGGGRMRALGVIAATAGPWYDLSRADHGYVHLWSTSTSTSIVTIEASSQPVLGKPPSPAVILTTVTNVANAGSYYVLPVLSNIRVNVSTLSAGTVYAIIEGFAGSGVPGFRIDPALVRGQ